jgi:PAS domain S-box-containing protein
MKKNILHVCALVLMIAYLLAIVVFAIIDVQTVFEPKGLLPALNTLFTGLLPLAVAVIAARAYLQSGQFSVLCIGCGMLTFGLGSTVAGWLIQLPDGPNLNITIHNFGVFFGSLFHLIGAVFTLTMPGASGRAVTRKRIWLSCYAGILIGMMGLTYAAVCHFVPSFFLQGIGPTPIRQAVLGMAIIFYVFSAGIFLNLSVKSKAAFLYWYCVSLNMIAIGLLAAFILKFAGSPISWLGRSAQYIGGVFALTAITSALRSAAKVDAPLENIIASFFSEAETRYKNLVETATDAIISCDQTGKILLWNTTAANLLGYTSAEAIGLSLFGTIIPEKFSALRAKIAQMITLDQASSRETEQIEVTSKDGNLVPVEFSLSLQKLPPGWVVTFIFRDITGRKRAQEELRDLLLRYETLLAAVPEIIMEVDHNKVYTWANQAGIEFFGEDVLGKEAAYFFEGVQGTYETVKPIFDGAENTIYVESWQRRKDGEKRLLAWWCRALKDGSGNVIGAISSARDITERKQAEEKLWKSEKKLRETQEMAHLGFWSWDVKTGDVEWSDEVFKIFGLNPKEFTPHIDSILALSPWPEDHLRDQELINRAIENHGPGFYEQKFLCPDQSIGYYYSTFQGNYDENGHLISIVGTVLDITDRKRAEEALRASEDKFKYVFDHSTIGKSITRPSGEISVNQTFCEMLGYTPEELRHQRWQNITHPDDIELTQKALDPLFSGKQTSTRFSKRYLHKDGSVVWADVSTSLRRDQDGKPLYFMTAVSDITDRKRAEAERERLVTELALKNKELEQLVYVTSHDLRSPLLNVQGFSQELRHAVQDLAALLQSPEVPEHLRQKAAALVENDLQEDLHYILASIAKMDVLLAGLLKLSRLGRTVLTITTLNLNTLIANVLTTFEFHIQEAGVTVEVAELPSCTGDATQINQVFSNLLDNALKYRDPNRAGVIKIWGYTEQAQAIYCVEDNGIGIAPEDHPKIFEIFQRLNPDQSPGEGLGLTIVCRMLERQGGKVWVESEPGKGSKFYVSLPGT